MISFVPASIGPGSAVGPTRCLLFRRDALVFRADERPNLVCLNPLRVNAAHRRVVESRAAHATVHQKLRYHVDGYITPPRQNASACRRPASKESRLDCQSDHCQSPAHALTIMSHTLDKA